MSRKVYDRQFKMAAVQLVLEENMFIKEVAKELSIHSNTLYSWINEYEEYGESAFPGRGSALVLVQRMNRDYIRHGFLTESALIRSIQTSAG
ncbi:transposase [Bacillus cereus]|nr:transposase [Bacillus cereus]